MRHNSDTANLFDVHSQYGLYEVRADEARVFEISGLITASLDKRAAFWPAWCDVEPIVITPAGSHASGLPADATAWLTQDRDAVTISPSVKAKIGDEIEYLNYGETRKGRIVKILASGLLHVERLSGPMTGSITWIHPDSIKGKS